MVEQKNSSTLTPGIKQQTMRIPVTVSHAAWPAYLNGSCRLYIWGRVTYCDVFKYHHFRNFCAIWLPTTVHTADAPNPFTDCEIHDDGDENYPETPPVACAQ